MKVANAQCQVCGARAIFRGQDVIAVLAEIDRRQWHDEPGSNGGIVFTCPACWDERDDSALGEPE